MSTDVTLTNIYGDHMHGHLFYPASDQPAVIRVNGTEFFETVWAAKGWWVRHDQD